MLIVLTNPAAFPTSQRSSLSKGALAGIVLGVIAGTVTLSSVVFLLIMRRHVRNASAIARKRRGMFCLRCLAFR